MRSRALVRHVRQLMHDDRDVSGLLFACAAMNFFALVAGTELRRSVLCKQLVCSVGLVATNMWLPALNE